MFASPLQVGVTSIGKACSTPTSYRRAPGSIATSSTIKPSKLTAPTTAGRQTLPSHFWQQRLPPGFLMTVKAPRALTHSKRLYSPEKWLERMSEGLQCLGDRLGILLAQLPPQFGCDSASLAYCLERVPPWIEVAVEFRHPSWHAEEVFSMLEREGAVYCAFFAGRTCRASSAQRGHSSTCGSTAPTPITSTAALTRMRICSGRPSAFRIGKVRDTARSSTSTTTEREMQ